ncbi:MAG: 3'(2'),5'-bisphosphate nucleotidase CysQ [Thiomicrospira sp.]
MIPTQVEYRAWLPQVCKIARQAGALILEIYRCADCTVEKKADGSPVTQADKLADAAIRHALQGLTPHIPIVSEESIDDNAFAQRQTWSVYWLVDPLDGTKEFIERTDEFCVNIALVVNQRAQLGVVYGPVQDVLYAGYVGGEATKQQGEQTQVIHVRTPSAPIKVAVSRRHGKRVAEFIDALVDAQTVNMGSALKSCLVAEGAVDVYPRFGPTSHWDTAASQAIVEAAGGRIVDAQHQDLRYVASPDLLNPFFMVIGDANYPWPSFPS